MGRPFYKSLWAFRQTLIVVITPLILLAIPLNFPGKEGRCAYAIAIMAVYWMTEALPMAATALLPIPLFPFLGVVGSKELCANYLKDTNFLFVSGLVIAVAVERWNLHKRIALKVLVLVGSKPQWLMLGFMGTTCFLSMWLSNTATAAMLMPIAHAVISEMDENRKRHRKDGLMNGKVCGDSDSEEHSLHDMENGGMASLDQGKLNILQSPGATENALALPEPKALVPAAAPISPMDSGVFLNVPDGYNSEPPEITSSTQLTSNDSPMTIVTRQQLKEDRRFHDLGVGLRISIAFAANIGGTGTLTGTGPNLVLKGQVDTIFGEKTDLNFSSWFMFAFPNMVLCLIVAWFVMMFVFIGPRRMFRLSDKNEKDTEEAANAIIKHEYQKLGTMSFAEVLVLILFIILALAWMTRDPAFMPGWGSLPFIESSFITDACVGMTIACLLFILPSRKPNFLCFKSKGDITNASPAPALLDWKTVNDNLAWSVVIVLGGSFALADACQKSGLSLALGGMFNMFLGLPPWVLALVLSTITTLVTQITSNTATSTIFLPIVAQLAETVGVNPFYLMFPVAISASLAFMLPVATPPNAIVFAYGNTRIIDMVKAGLVLNFLCTFILQFSLNSYGISVFDLDEYPKWAPLHNTTTAHLSDTVAATVLNMTTPTPLAAYTDV